jgi:serine kinase of HPr protein (carbohydrate metabolism regulator)
VPAPNVHGTAVLLADKGVLITGRSGAGKTALALALIDALRAKGRFARLISDDQLFVSAVGGKLIVRTPPPLHSLVEIHGVGPMKIVSENGAVIDLVVMLVDAASAPRFQEDSAENIAGVAVPTLALPERNARGAVVAVCAKLEI